MHDIVLQYARFFFGSSNAEVWAEALEGLELNWRGPPGRDNVLISKTLATLQTLVESPCAKPAQHHDATAHAIDGDWRSQMYLKRGYYDAYVQKRFVWEVELQEAEALEAVCLSTCFCRRRRRLSCRCRSWWCCRWEGAGVSCQYFCVFHESCW